MSTTISRSQRSEERAESTIRGMQGKHHLEWLASLDRFTTFRDLDAEFWGHVPLAIPNLPSGPDQYQRTHTNARCTKIYGSPDMPTSTVRGLNERRNCC